MFLKRQTRRKNGKARVCWEFLESVRTPRGSGHKRVAYLGELSESERAGWARLATLLDGKAASSARQLSLFENAPDDGDPVPDEVAVFILCRSADCRGEEKAMHERFEKGIEEGLTKIVNGCE